MAEVECLKHRLKLTSFNAYANQRIFNIFDVALAEKVAENRTAADFTCFYIQGHFYSARREARIPVIGILRGLPVIPVPVFILLLDKFIDRLPVCAGEFITLDRKSTRLNSSHV